MRRIGRVGVLIGLAFVLSGCFQSAGSAVEPTIANATATNMIPIEPTFPTPLPQVTAPPIGGGGNITPTPFMTPIGPEGFQTPIPTIEPIQPTIAPVEPTIPPTDPASVQPTVAPVEPTIAPSTQPGTQPTAGGTPIIEPTATVSAVEPSLATPTPLPTDPPCEYTVERNDTFYAIARKLKIDPLELIAANPRTNQNALQIGEKLLIPNCKPSAPGTPTHSASASGTPSAPGGATALPAGIQAVYVVQSGDTLGRIAQRYGVTVQEIVRANGFANENVILNVNQKILIPARSQ